MTLEVHVLNDDKPKNPRNQICLGTMVCAHNYDFGEDMDTNYNCEPWGDIIPEKSTHIRLHLAGEDLIAEAFGKVIPDDAKCIGFIFVSDDLARIILGWKSITKGRRLKILDYLHDEVEKYNSFRRGAVWCYKIKDGETVVAEDHGFWTETSARETGDAAAKLLSRLVV
jgi:hypothetical protein